MIGIHEVPPEVLHAIRRDVLRGGDPEARVHDDRDGDSAAMHFAAMDGENVVGSASVYPSNGPEGVAAGRSYQLRYLAVTSDLQRQGVGRQLMRAVEDRLCSLGVDLLWANGRDTALDFYVASDWRILDGSAHLSPETQLPHHVIVKSLADERDVEVRVATLDDAPALADLRARMMFAINLIDDRGSWVDATVDYFTDGLSSNTVRGYVATADGKIVASAMAEIRRTTPSPRKLTGRVAYIHTVATLPTFRRRGISRTLLQLLINDVESLGLDVIELHATDQGRPLYEELQFSLKGDNEMRRWIPRSQS